MKTPLVSLTDVRKSFGSNLVLHGLDFMIHESECIGLVGHNGAGKSTLINILTGALAADSGAIMAMGQDVSQYSVVVAHAIGIRCVFQELSLCPNLTVAENMRVFHHGLSGRGWRERAGQLISARLDEIFPGHGIRSDAVVGDLTLAQRQMVEIARAFTAVDVPVKLVLLDEPTSSLDAVSSEQLLAYVRKVVQAGCSVILISHMIGEILRVADRSVVMRDGRIVADMGREATKEALVSAMGNVGKEAQSGRRSGAPKACEGEARIRHQIHGHELTAMAGEVIGLAGLAGHGQSRVLLDLFRQMQDDEVAFVAGDRVNDGVFPQWSIQHNLAVASMRDLGVTGFIAAQQEETLGADWKKRIKIKTADMNDPILSLSGGNQQKVLFARALATKASVVLMDDPLRGVDLGTKLEIYQLIRSETQKGRTFIWYSTEMDELEYCDRVYVFNGGRITASIDAQELTEEKVIHASFAEAQT